MYLVLLLFLIRSRFLNAPSPIAVTESGIVKLPVFSSINNKFPFDDNNTPSTISYGFTSIPKFCATLISFLSCVFISNSPFITSSFSKYTSLISFIIVFIFPVSSFLHLI